MGDEASGSLRLRRASLGRVGMSGGAMVAAHGRSLGDDADLGTDRHKAGRAEKGGTETSGHLRLQQVRNIDNA